MKIYFFCFDLQNWQNNFRFTICTKHVNQQRICVIFWLNWRNYGPVSYSFSCKLCVKMYKVKVLGIRMRVQKLVQSILWTPNMRIFFLSFFSNPISLSSVQFLAPRSPCHIHKVANLTPDDDENSRARVHIS